MLLDKNLHLSKNQKRRAYKDLVHLESIISFLFNILIKSIPLVRKLKRAWFPKNDYEKKLLSFIYSLPDDVDFCKELKKYGCFLNVHYRKGISVNSSQTTITATDSPLTLNTFYRSDAKYTIQDIKIETDDNTFVISCAGYFMLCKKIIRMCEDKVYYENNRKKKNLEEQLEKAYTDHIL